MNRKTMGIALGISAVAAGAVTAAALASVGWKHHETKHVGGRIHAVVIEEDAGNIHVASEGRRDVLVRATTSWIIHEPHLTTKVVDGVLRIETRGGGLLSGTNYSVKVPNGVTITATTDAGKVDVDAVSRHITAKTNAGDVHVKVPAGRYAVDADTDAGDVNVRGLVRDDSAPRSISARTDAGDVTVEAR
jgi:hypothetical protein